MKVYIIEYSDYDEHGIAGVYSSRRKAEEVLKDIKPARYRYMHEIVPHMVNNPKWYDEGF